METKEIGKFINDLPEDTLVVAVIQRGTQRVILRTPNVEEEVEARKPNWPKAVWDGVWEGARNASS